MVSDVDASTRPAETEHQASGRLGGSIRYAGTRTVTPDMLSRATVELPESD